MIKNDDDSYNLKGLNIFINSLMQQLWEQPKLVYLILSNANIKDMKNNLAYLFCNNFYENIFNPNFLEDNLLFVISLLLKKEINDLNTIKDVNQFLMESTCGFLLEQLKERKDIQIYFKKILNDLIEKTETVFSSKRIDFDVAKIEEEIKLLEEKKKDPKSLQAKKELYNCYLKKKSNITIDMEENTGEEEIKLDIEQDRKQIFHTKYMVSLTIDELKKIQKLNEEKEEEETNEDMKIYLEHHLNIMKNNESIYMNDNFLANICKSQLSQEIFSMYQNMFIELIDILNQLIQSLLDNIAFIPDSIKVISKIILLLLKKKFPNINTIEQNMFLSNFLLSQLLSNFLNNPSLLLLINKMISENTLQNLRLISSLLIKLVSCKLYENYSNECIYTPFNWFFLDEMPKIIKLFKNLTKNVKIPKIITQLINGEIDKNETSNYFKDKNDLIGHRSICYSYNDLFILLDTIDKSKNILFTDDKTSSLEKTYEKLSNQNAKKIFDNIKKNIQNELLKAKTQKKESQKPMLKYFLISDLLINNEKTNLFTKIDQNENSQTNTIMSIKDNLCNILNENKLISEADFDTNDIKTISFNDIFNQFKTLNELSYYSQDGIIPVNHNINWLIDNLQYLQEELKANDYKILLLQIYQDKLTSMNNIINYKDIVYCIDKIEIAKRYNNIYQQAKQIIFDIDINNKVKSMVENENISVDVIFKYNKDTKELIIEKTKKEKKTITSKDNFKVEKDADNKIISFEYKENCHTINEFINAFPDIAAISELNEENIFDIFNNIQINKKLEDFFKILEDQFPLLAPKTVSNNLPLLSDNIMYYPDNEGSEKMSLKLRDYIMEKLYDKIFPKASDWLDNKIYLNCVKLSWTEPKHFFKKEIIGNNDNAKFYFKRFVNEMKLLFKNVEKEKTPLKKVELIYKIIEVMDKCFMSKNMNYPPEFVKSLLIYTIIKIRPSWLHSNCSFITLFVNEHKDKTGERMLEILNQACKFFNEISYKYLLEVDEKEFNEKCEQSFNEFEC